MWRKVLEVPWCSSYIRIISFSNTWGRKIRVGIPGRMGSRCPHRTFMDLTVILGA
jgi:hypothetical protein